MPQQTDRKKILELIKKLDLVISEESIEKIRVLYFHDSNIEELNFFNSRDRDRVLEILEYILENRKKHQGFLADLKALLSEKMNQNES